MASKKTHERIVDATMKLAARGPWERVTLEAIAEEAKVSLAALRDAFGTRIEILDAFSERIDREVLENLDEDMDDEAPRERLFDVLFARFEALQPYRPAIASIVDGARRDPLFALAMNTVVVRSMAWMMTGAGIDAGGTDGAFRAQGVAFVWARTMRVWLEDDDPGLARTMAELDRQLRDGELQARRIYRLLRYVPRLPRRRYRRPFQGPPSKEVA